MRIILLRIQYTNSPNTKLSFSGFQTTSDLFIAMMKSLQLCQSVSSGGTNYFDSLRSDKKKRKLDHNEDSLNQFCNLLEATSEEKLQSMNASLLILITVCHQLLLAYIHLI
jgi:hypothetical protein